MEESKQPSCPGDQHEAFDDWIKELYERDKRYPGIPVVWYDRQGHDLCATLRTEFPHCNGFHRGLAFRQDQHWRCGSRLRFYSSLDQADQYRITDRVRHLVESNDYCPVLLEYFKTEDRHRRGAVPFATIQVGEGEAVELDWP